MAGMASAALRDRREIDEHGAIRQAILHRLGRGEGETRLPDAAGAGERDQPRRRVLEQGDEPCDLGVAADELGAGRRQDGCEIGRSRERNDALARHEWQRQVPLPGKAHHVVADDAPRCSLTCRRQVTGSNRAADGCLAQPKRRGCLADREDRRVIADARGRSAGLVTMRRIPLPA